jgi:hypothetical protein
MGLFIKSKRTAVAATAAEQEPGTWPADALVDVDVDDAAFAAAIEKGRAAEASRRVVVAA